MNGQNFTVCRNCGGPMERVSPENTSPLIMECRLCSHREWAEIQVSPTWAPVQRDMAYARVVVTRIESQAGAGEIQALRELNQEIAALPMDEAAKRIGSSQTIDLGTHPLDIAQKLLKRAEGLGLKARLKHPEGEPPLDGKQSTGLLGAPVTVDEPGKAGTVIPFIWIVIGTALIIAVIVWVLL
ncbi:hypothetical protein ACFL4N_05080 [Thermodesulfobacteriota bacterium]